MVDRNQTTASTEQHKPDNLVRQRTTEREQWVYNHDFDNVPKACMTQVCSAGKTAQARRNKKSEKQQREDKIVADLRRDKRELMGEIRRKELVVQEKELDIQELGIRIRKMELEQRVCTRTMEREHQAELAGRDHTEAILLSDLREMCQFRDEEVEGLRTIIDRQALPPTYDQIDTLVHVDSVMDVATANATTVLSSAKTSLRQTIAETHNRSDGLLRIAQSFLNAMSSITRANNKGTWPLNCTFQILQAIHEICSRVSRCITLSQDDHDDEDTLSQSRRSLLLSYLDTTKRTYRTLRKAFISADNLAFGILYHHFSSGGRRAGLNTPAIPFIYPLYGEMDLEDEFQELHYWKAGFEGVKREILDWRDDVGVVVFVDSLAWLEQRVMAAV